MGAPLDVDAAPRLFPIGEDAGPTDAWEGGQAGDYQEQSDMMSGVNYEVYSGLSWRRPT